MNHCLDAGQFLPFLCSTFYWLVPFVFQDTTSFYTIQSSKVLTQDNWANPERSCLDTLDDVRVSILDLDHTLPHLLSHLSFSFFITFSLSFQSRSPPPLCNDLPSIPATRERSLDVQQTLRFTFCYSLTTRRNYQPLQIWVTVSHVSGATRAKKWLR